MRARAYRHVTACKKGKIGGFLEGSLGPIEGGVAKKKRARIDGIRSPD